jgi:hypothetical protein
MKNSNDTVGNRSRDLPVCSAVPQPLCYCVPQYVARKGKGKIIPLTGLWGPEGSGKLRLPDSVTSALEGGTLSGLNTGRLYPQKYPGTHFKRLSRPRAHGIV